MADHGSLVTYWTTPGKREKELSSIAPGDEYEHVIRPQRFIVLHQLVTHGPILVGLGVGACNGVPFELESADGNVRRYRLKDLDVRFFDRALAKVGAAAIDSRAIAIPPGMDVRLQLRNESLDPIEPRAGILVEEEVR